MFPLVILQLIQEYNDDCLYDVVPWIPSSIKRKRRFLYQNPNARVLCQSYKIHWFALCKNPSVWAFDLLFHAKAKIF